MSLAPMLVKLNSPKDSLVAASARRLCIWASRSSWLGCAAGLPTPRAAVKSTKQRRRSGNRRVPGMRVRATSARRSAILSSLAQRAGENAIVVLHGLKLEQPKTKALLTALKAAGIPENALLVFAEENGEVVLSGLNLPRLGLLHFSELNAYDVLLHSTVVFTEEALKGAEEVYA